MAARQPHKLEVTGSNPVPATTAIRDDANLFVLLWRTLQWLTAVSIFTKYPNNLGKEQEKRMSEYSFRGEANDLVCLLKCLLEFLTAARAISEAPLCRNRREEETESAGSDHRSP